MSSFCKKSERAAGCGPRCSSALVSQAKVQVWASPDSYLEALRQHLFPSSSGLWTDFSSLQLQSRRPPCLAGCQLGASLTPEGPLQSSSCAPHPGALDPSHTKKLSGLPFRYLSSAFNLRNFSALKAAMCLDWAHHLHNLG